MKSHLRYRELIEVCKQHAKLDEATAKIWVEEADIYARLAEIARRQELLEANEKQVGSADPA